LDWLSSQGAVFGDCSGLVRDDKYRKRKRKKERERESKSERRIRAGTWTMAVITLHVSCSSHNFEAL